MSRILLVVALLLGAGGCSAAGIPNPFDRASREGGRLRIEVSNLNFNDATLHALTGGTRLRLGTVTGKSDTRYTIDWPISRDLWIEVDLVGEGVFTTNAVSAQPGTMVQLFIESDSRRTRLIHGTR